MLSPVLGVVGTVLLIFFVSGGWVYREECSTEGGDVVGWNLGEGALPYLAEFTEPPPMCERDSLVRYLAGKLGLMEDHAD